MSDEGLKQLDLLLEPRKVAAGTHLVQQGEISHETFFIQEGVCRNYNLIDGKEKTRWFALDGDIVASMFSFAHNEPAVASIEALTAMDLLVADTQDIRKLIRSSHEWSLWTSEYLIDGLYVLERRYTFLGHGDAYTRYENLQRMRSFELLNQIPLQYLASYLNITPQTLSRVRRQLGRRMK